MNVAYGPVELKKVLEEAARVSQVCLASCFPAFETCLNIYTYLNEHNIPAQPVEWPLHSAGVNSTATR